MDDGIKITGSIIFGAILLMGVFLNLGQNFFVDQQSLKTLNQQVTGTVFNQSFTLNQQNIQTATVTVINATCNQGDCASSPNSTLRINNEFTFARGSSRLTLSNRTGTFNVTATYEPALYTTNGIQSTIFSGILVIMTLIVLVWMWRASSGE